MQLISTPKLDLHKFFEALSKLREKNIETPILMLTALNMLQNKVQGFNIGVDDYLVKPFER